MSSKATAVGMACLLIPPTASQANKQRVGRKAFPSLPSVGMPSRSTHPMLYLSMLYTGLEFSESSVLRALSIDARYFKNIFGKTVGISDDRDQMSLFTYIAKLEASPEF